MKLIFAGTPEFAKVQLQALIEQGHKIDLVLTQPDRPAGRGQKLAMSPVKAYALEQGLTVEQPTSLKDESIVTKLTNIKPDLIIVSAYGMLLPQHILDLPRLGCWNVHASLLPRWRGAAPIHYAILKGDRETGISLMQMEAGLDSGPVLLKAGIPIEDDDTTGSLHDKLATLGAQVLLDGLQQSEHLEPKVQDEQLVTLCPKIKKEQAKIDWHQNTHDIERAIRAFNPAPGAYTFYHGERIKVLQAKILTEHEPQSPGQVQHISKHGLDISTKDGLLQIQLLQLPGKKPQTLEQIINAKPDFFKVGSEFE